VPFAQFSGRDSVFGYQGMAGLQFHVFGQATLNAGFRLVKREDLDVRDVFTSARQAVKLDTNRVFELGLAIGF
jgi:opacity protein-like surface antigen